ncbi:hypothetical protein B7R22_17930 [Subtercola boreus]|uniref:DUF6891 domain-containing protein n=1 Tax=Subtercola boreus TaxID=120213 RepID=A0A3E0VP56_9MICO|nr:hypothetical protein [Subtercola boreus]RFA11752.1 hypothetical protein B7R22_17930 [Subtercola boreus]
MLDVDQLAAMPETDRPDRADAYAFLREQAWEAIAPGFAQRGEIEALFDELVEYDDTFPLSAADVREVIRELWAKRMEELAVAGPRDPSDDHRVEVAFAALTSSGVVASMNLGNDRGDATHESISLIRDGRGGPGFVFFHRQDANRLAYPDATLYVGFDAAIEDAGERDRVAREVAQKTVSELERQGLQVSWNGSLETRIAVVNVNWRRPLPD